MRPLSAPGPSQPSSKSGVSSSSASAARPAWVEAARGSSQSAGGEVRISGFAGAASAVAAGAEAVAGAWACAGTGGAKL